MSLIHSTMAYSATIWDPYHEKDIDKLYKVEQRASRFIANDYRYDTTSMTRNFKSLELNGHFKYGLSQSSQAEMPSTFKMAVSHKKFRGNPKCCSLYEET